MTMIKSPPLFQPTGSNLEENMAGRGNSALEIWEVRDVFSNPEHEHEPREHVAGADAGNQEDGSVQEGNLRGYEDNLRFPREDICISLGEFLDIAGTAAAIYSHGAFPYAPNPGLSIKGHVIKRTTRTMLKNTRQINTVGFFWHTRSRFVTISGLRLKTILSKVRYDFGLSGKRTDKILTALVLSEDEGTINSRQ
ncbi:hypothetical protein BPAE_0072g00010 [Botrytis paeoniae]|uniref:Uncharacterized protein n=1 Tax=Botrytis paeoniae TaxID=278948 RepID=A0A4Z1FS99_9HELO|nr:hypothetical protein BPAE_0072g00010 [Botrytis paeoniae]